jgi:hypothetical protein
MLNKPPQVQTERLLVSEKWTGSRIGIIAICRSKQQLNCKKGHLNWKIKKNNLIGY